jgi:hypothetical protein
MGEGALHPQLQHQPRSGEHDQLDQRRELRGLRSRRLDEPIVTARRGRSLHRVWQRVSGYADNTVAFNPFDANIATATDRTGLVKIGGQWTHLFAGNIETNINGGWVQSFASHSGIVATVTGDGIVVPTMGNQVWFEYGGRLGFRVHKGWIVDLFANGTLGPQPVGNTVHGGVGLRINY